MNYWRPTLKKTMAICHGTTAIRHMQLRLFCDRLAHSANTVLTPDRRPLRCPCSAGGTPIGVLSLYGEISMGRSLTEAPGLSIVKTPQKENPG